MNTKLLKTAVVAVNVVLLIFGIIFAALGIWVLAVDYGIVKLGNIKDDGLYSPTFDEPGMLESAAVICIVVGVVTVILSILIFCGVRKESKCYMAICVSLMAVLILLDVVVIILTAFGNQRTEKHLQGALLEGVENHYDSLITSHMKFSVYFDRAQVQLECCGVVNYTDFRSKSLTWTEKTEFEIPRTCCLMNSKSSYLHNDKYDLVNVECPRNRKLSHLQPCYSPIKDWLAEKAFVLLAVSVIIAVLKMIAIIVDIILFRNFKEDTPYNDM